MAGQGVFLRNGLMQYGSVFGHGAYLGPDLHRRLPAPLGALRARELRGRGLRPGDGADRRGLQGEPLRPRDARRSSSPRRRQPPSRSCGSYYGRYFGEPTTKYGLRPEAISDPGEIRQLTAYFAWTAWAASALRPGTDYSYTNNWPPEPLVENEPTAERRGVERLVPDRLARRHRVALRGLRPVELPRLARARAGDPVLPHTRRRGAHAGAAGVRVVLSGHGRAVLASRRWSGRRPSTTGRIWRASSA